MRSGRAEFSPDYESKKVQKAQAAAPRGLFAKTDVPPVGQCERCHKRKATEWWTASVLHMNHGMKRAWCERCVVEVQLEHARERAAAIPDLEARLKELP